jgi:hypothetical protein
MTAEMRRPPPGGIAGAAEARLRGVEPDVHAERLGAHSTHLMFTLSGHPTHRVAGLISSDR